ncbi:MAG: ATP-dependent DNA helicase RecG [Candidatus Cloacimonetes bacterium]|nr:ATP-dependent DNA helicase RecG [Candidatus Cloacimonadota bacterium]
MQPSDSITKIPFIGPQKAKLLAKLGITTVGDLLYHFPARYEDYTKIAPIAEIDLESQEKVTVQGKVWQIVTSRTKTGKLFTQVAVNDETGSIQALWWNQPWIANSLKAETEVSLSGKIGWWGRKPTLVNPEWELVGSKWLVASGKKSPNYSLPTTCHPPETTNHKLVHTGRLVPIYPETEGISSKWLRSRINWLLVTGYWLLEKIEFLPSTIKSKYELVDLDKALRRIHYPQNKQEIKSARERLGFDELFLLQLKAARRRAKWEKREATFQFSINNFQSTINNFIQNLPFKLTNAQERATKDILDDLAKNKPMNRLLQGDVGSGKTVVAAIAMYATHLAGYQSALMAPTEVLAEQHFKTVSKLLASLNINVVLRTGSRKDLVDVVNVVSPSASGKCEQLPQAKRYHKQSATTSKASSHIVIGTHALIFAGIQFAKLGLVVIDEQHRFGVRQRAKLVKKAKKDTPHVLTMTATPIPRSVALTIYGDQDLSIIDEMPPGRLPIETWVVPPVKRLAAYQWIKDQIVNVEDAEKCAEAQKKNNHFSASASSAFQRLQAFIVYPLIDPSEAETMADVKAATAEFEKLKHYIFSDLNVGLLHGRMKAREKTEILEKFRNGKLDILVATPVVEVGIDIASATIIVIEGAERFGLASLHQLRGRVGRGGQQAYCLLFTESKDPEVIGRLKYMEKYQDGMKLAEFDLERRGPGELFGVKQHGFLDLKIAKLTDLELVEKTKRAADEVLPELEKYPKLCGKMEGKKV